MTRLIDLSCPLQSGMWSYNVLPDMGLHLAELVVEQVATIPRQGYEAFRFEMSSLTGTYLETGRHMLDDSPVLSDLAPRDFIRPAVVCHLPGKTAEQVIHGPELAEHCPPVRAGDALLIDCGWALQVWEPNYVTGSPAFHYDCLPWLLAQPFSILGVDVPCIESARSRPDGEATGNMLVPIFQRRVLLLAPLVNLDQITSNRGELIALPLNLQGVSGAPCRAIFREE